MKTEIAEIIYQRIWKTRGARFIAHSNYLVQSKYSAFTIGILSSYVIILSLLFLSPKFNHILSTGDLSLLTLTASLFTLIFSQIESSKDYKLKADKLHRNALELSDVYNAAQKNHMSSLDNEKKNTLAEDLNKEYNSILKKCDENHHNYDFQLFLAQTNNDENKFMSKKRANWLKLFVYVRIRFYYCLWLICPVILFFILIN